MAETIHLSLKSNGKDIKGQSTQTSLGRADTIECLSFEYGVTSERDPHSGHSTGRRQHIPVTIRKRIDSSTPLLLKALCENQNIEGTFKFFRPAVEDGAPEQFYTVAVKKGRINAVHQHAQVVPKGAHAPPVDPKKAGAGWDEPMEEVSFSFHTISWTYEDGGITHEDTWEKS